MSEEGICEILSKQKHSLPKLNHEIVEKISKSLTDIIYESFKQKLPSATEKRLTILKYLRSLNCNSENHLRINEQNYEIFLNSVQKVYENSDDIGDNFQNILKKIQIELKRDDPDNLRNEITKFNARRIRANELKHKKLETIRNFDQEQLNFTHKISKSYLFSDTNPEIINLLFDDNPNAARNHLNVTESPQFRHKQVKYAYALLCCQQLRFLKPILGKLSQYCGLLPEEKEFLVDFTCRLDLHREGELAGIILKQFGFVFELILIKLCTGLVQGAEASLVEVLRRFSRFDSSLGLKLKGMVYELYAWSFCNELILELLVELS